MRFVSATEIDTWRLCQRKWSYRWVEQVKGEAHPAAKLGTECHAALEAWLLHGTVPDINTRVGRIVVPALPLLPPPQTPGVLVEHAFTFSHYKGRIDLAWFDTVTGIPRVWDHKTTANPQYAETEESLPRNTQAILYGAWACQKWGADQVDVTFGYLSTVPPPTAHLVSARLQAHELREGLARCDATAHEINAAFSSTSPGDVAKLPPSPEACDAYGGCPYRDRCPVDPLAHTRSYLSLLQRMKAAAAQQSTTGSLPPAEASTPTVAAQAVIEAVTQQMSLTLPPEAMTPAIADTEPAPPPAAAAAPKRGRPRKDETPPPAPAAEDRLAIQVFLAALQAPPGRNLEDLAREALAASKILGG